MQLQPLCALQDMCKPDKQNISCSTFVTSHLRFFIEPFASLGALRRPVAHSGKKYRVPTPSCRQQQQRSGKHAQHVSFKIRCQALCCAAHLHSSHQPWQRQHVECCLVVDVVADVEQVPQAEVDANFQRLLEVA
eukprot:5331-Heterococcus_DN1.PRE.3